MKFVSATSLAYENIASILDGIDAIVYVADMSTHKIIFANQFARNILGDISGEICWERIWNKRSGPCSPCAGAGYLGSGDNSSGVDKWSLMNSNNGRWYEVSGRAVPWSNGRMARLEIAADITERKWIEEINRRSVADWENTFDTIGDLITIQDRNFNIIRANRTAEKIFGLPAKEIIKSKCYKLFHGRNTPPSDCMSCQCLETGQADSYEYFETGLNKYLEVKVIPRLNSNKRIVGLVHIAKDITERKKTENELIEHRKNLARLVEEKTSKLSSAIELLNHEILHSRQMEEELRVAEKKYRKLFEHAPDMYHALNTDMIITDCNQTEAKILGYKKSEIIGKSLADFFTEESRKLLNQDFPKLRKKKALKNLARTFVRKDGTTFPVILNVFADYDKNGELVQTRAIARDISDLKKAERELMKANRMLEMLSECNTALLHITEENELLNEICRIIVGTGGYRLAWVGYTEINGDKKVRPAAYAGFNDQYIDIVTGDWVGSGSDNSPLWRAIEMGGTSRARDIVINPGPDLWRSEAAKRGFDSLLAIPLTVEDSVTGILNIYSSEASAFNNDEIGLLQKLADNLSYGLKVFRTNTEREIARAEALRASHLASLGELAAGVAHEINNPINGIINYAQILANKGKPDTEELDIANRIIRESDRIAGIVRNLLSFARDRDEGKVPTNIREVLSYAIALTETQIRKDGIKLILDIPTLVPTITAQPQHLEQVFLNIISNSRYALNQKFAGENENKILEIRINTKIADNKHFLQITFYDSGTGISADIMNKVMNPFFSTKPSNVGTGLGLSISHGIISDHEGKLSIDSIKGEFTKIVIELPVSVRTGNEDLKKVGIN